MSTAGIAPTRTGFRMPYVTPALLRVARTFRRKEVWRIETSEKIVALTFDDGPSARAFAEVLAVLKEHDVLATFFLLGDRVAEGSDDGSALRRAHVRQAVEEGHEIAFHGWKHQSVSKYRAPALASDLEKFRAELKTLLDPLPSPPVRFFPPPLGHIEPYVHRVMKQERMRVVQTDVLPGDRSFFPSHFAEDKERAVERILRETIPGSIICLHVGEDLGRRDAVYDCPDAASIVAAIIPELRRRGYRFARLAELIP
jgi:peptidoglycan/xylan/chitin deacetylase (PgdA/CDA1 family)